MLCAEHVSIHFANNDGMKNRKRKKKEKPGGQRESPAHPVDKTVVKGKKL